MVRQLFTVTAAVALLAGCSGGNDTKSGSTPDGGGRSSTPSGPALTPYDPPKAFTTVAAVPLAQTPKSSDARTKAGMIGQTALVVTPDGITGRSVAGQGSPWTIPSEDTPDTETLDSTAPMAVQLNGKETIAVAYLQRVKGSGTQKAKGQVSFRWIDPVEGRPVASVTLDLTPTLGPGHGGDQIVSETFDATTGQVAVGLSAGSVEAAKAAGDTFTAYADPATKKADAVRFVLPVGVLNGVIVGAKGREGEGGGTGDRSIVVADATTGTIKKTTAVGMNYLSAAGSGSKHAYLSGQKYVPAPPGKIDGRWDSILFAVDLASGAIVETKSPSVDPQTGVTYSCWSDQQTSVVCTGSRNRDKVEILGVDDKTGKKAWGYTANSTNRVVPDVTTAFHGLVYAQAEAGPILVNAATGQDVPAPTPTPAAGATPTEGTTPTDGNSPTDGSSPSAGDSSPSQDTGSANGSDLSLLDGKPKSPSMVSPYGSTYLQDPSGTSVGIETILVVQKAVS